MNIIKPERLTILLVSYPFAPVGEDAVGGAEQILTMLESGLAKLGHRTFVIAAEGSRVAGQLIASAPVRRQLDEQVAERVRREYARLIQETVDRTSVDLIHFHGLDFHQYLPDSDVPLLAALHLPRDYYPADALERCRERVRFNCVSASQRDTFVRDGFDVTVVPNGIDVHRFESRPREGFALALGRICPEKNFEAAIHAAKTADLDLIVAGEIFPYESHRQYFYERIAPLLDGRRRFIGPVGFEAKRDLLARAKCLLIPSTVAETSSLVAMEALASGTPVIAFRSGALPEIVDDGRTGYIVSNAEEMSKAILHVDRIDRELCRQTACERFSSERMIAQYLELYHRIANGNRRSVRDRTTLE